MGEPKLGYADFPRLHAKIEAHPVRVAHIPPETLEWYKDKMRKDYERYLKSTGRLKTEVDHNSPIRRPSF